MDFITSQVLLQIKRQEVQEMVICGKNKKQLIRIFTLKEDLGGPP